MLFWHTKYASVYLLTIAVINVQVGFAAGSTAHLPTKQHLQTTEQQQFFQTLLEYGKQWHFK
jgi:hypothetical protein